MTERPSDDPNLRCRLEDAAVPCLTLAIPSTLIASIRAYASGEYILGTIATINGALVVAATISAVLQHLIDRPPLEA